MVFEVVFLASFCCGSVLDTAAAFLFDYAVLLFVLAWPLVAFLPLVETVTAGRPDEERQVYGRGWDRAEGEDLVTRDFQLHDMRQVTGGHLRHFSPAHVVCTCIKRSHGKERIFFVGKKLACKYY